MLNSATHHRIKPAKLWRASPLWGFVSLSTILHGAVLLLLQSPPLLPISAPSSTALAIHLSEEPMPAPARALPSPTRKLEHRTTASRASTARAVTEPANTRAKPTATTSPADKPMPPEESGTAAALPTALATTLGERELQSNLQITLQQEIARYFSYPLLARRRGWQGEVLLAFRLEADGRIVDARIARSSGYGILDRAALTALGKVKQVRSGTSRGFAMQLPVIYRLEG